MAQHFPRKTGKSLRHLFGLVFLLDMFSVVSAFDSQICCLKSARYNWTSGILPWDSCALGPNYVQGTYGLGEVPQVNATLGFCKENCPGVQISTVNEWLGLLTSWVLPAIALLLTCSTGSTSRVRHPNSITGGVLRSVPYQLRDFMAILGDPASAIRGAFSEVALNMSVVHNIYRAVGIDRVAKALAMVAGQTEFTECVDVGLTDLILRESLLAVIDSFKGLDPENVLVEIAEGEGPLLKPGSHRYEVIKEMRLALIKGEEDNLQKCLQALQDSLDLNEQHSPGDRVQRKLHDAIGKVLERRFAKTASEKGNFGIGDAKAGDPGTGYVGNQGDTKESLFKPRDCARDLKNGIRVTLKSRVDFMKGIVLPVILGLVATAGSFYNAYTQLGDNDTAHNLAYGVWYSWAIIIAVVSNCYVATANPGVAKLALQCDFLSDVTVPLRGRSENTQKWMKWLKDIGCGEGGDPGPASPEKGGFLYKSWPSLKRLFKPTLSPGKGSFRSKAWSSLKLLFEQTLAWVCIAMPCACAASISYTTPTVGLGCRSFTFLLYGICTLVLSWLSAYRSQVDKTDDIRSQQQVCLRMLYIFGVCVNVFIISAGTTFDLIGLYRTCRCEVLFASNDFLLQMSSNTALDVANAKKFWLPVGYIDFGFIWIVCVIAVTCRTYIAYNTNLLLNKWEKEDLSRSVECSCQME